MRRSRALRSALLCAAVLAGCAREDGGQEAGTRSRQRELTTAQVMEQVARAAYQPPAHGELTEEQVRQYLEVKRLGREMREKAKRAQEPGVSDLRAALELGHNPKEFSWTEGQVREAWIALRGQELDRKLAETRNQMLRDLETQLKSTTDPRQKKELEQQIAGIRAAAPLATEAPPAVGHNAALVRRFEADVAVALSGERGPQETHGR